MILCYLFGVIVAQVNAITLNNQTLDQALAQINAITW